MAIQIDGRSLTPDIAGQFALGQQRSNTLDNQRLQGQVQQFNLDRAKAGVLGDQQAAQQKTQNQQLAGSLIGGNFKGQERQKKIGELFAANPDLAAKTLTQLGVQDQASADEFANFAFDLQNTPFELRGPKIEQRAQLLTSQGRDPKDTISLANLNEDQQNQVAETIQLATLSVKDRMAARPKAVKQEGFSLSPGQQRFDAKGNLIASVAPGQVTARADQQVAEIPPVLVSGLSPEVAEKGAAAFSAAGGGKDGLTAFQKIVDAGSEQERRVASPQILKTSFPKASAPELAQLQATMDSAKTTQEGLKLAGKLREEQRRDTKGQVFQTRAVELLDGIVNSPDLGDVTGSIEGAYDFRPFSDDESALIADIEEAGNILTADNLSLMSGVLSESDIKILKNLAGGGLIRTRGEDRFRKDVTTLRDKLKSKLIVTADDTAKDRAAVNKQQTLTAPPSGKEGGELRVDAQGNKAWVFQDGSVEEVQ